MAVCMDTNAILSHLVDLAILLLKHVKDVEHVHEDMFYERDKF